MVVSDQDGGTDSMVTRSLLYRKAPRAVRNSRNGLLSLSGLAKSSLFDFLTGTYFLSCYI